MDRIWDISMYIPKHFVIFCQIKVIQGRKVQKGQIQNFERVVSCRNAKNDYRIPFVRLKAGKIWKRENAGILVKALKVTIWGIQIGKTQAFSR